VRDFPADFLWGSATSAHQVEGDNRGNDWWRWENSAATLAADLSGNGIDHFARYADDFALLASLGQNAHRMSLEWSRIQPARDHVDKAALDHYRRVLECLAEQGLTGVITLYHKTLPLWFADSGGWLAPDALDRFADYVSLVSAALGDMMPYACTINEPQILPLFGYATGQFPPALTDRAAAERVNDVLIAAHRTAVQAVRGSGSATRIGTCLQLVPLLPADPASQADVELTAWLDQMMTTSHIDDLRAGGDVGDFLGVQYYTRARVDASSSALLAPAAVDAEATQMGWEVYPEGFGAVLGLAATAGLPLIITENGIATDDDHQRVRFLDSHLNELRNAMHGGVDVRGYFYWSSFDNFEWNHGYAPTFGLIGIDRDNDFRRVARPSAHALGRVAASGRLEDLWPDTAPAAQTRLSPTA
jgi:beta-glucosidase